MHAEHPNCFAISNSLYTDSLSEPEHNTNPDMQQKLDRGALNVKLNAVINRNRGARWRRMIGQNKSARTADCASRRSLLIRTSWSDSPNEPIRSISVERS